MYGLAGLKARAAIGDILLSPHWPQLQLIFVGKLSNFSQLKWFLLSFFQGCNQLRFPNPELQTGFQCTIRTFCQTSIELELKLESDIKHCTFGSSNKSTKLFHAWQVATNLKFQNEHEPKKGKFRVNIKLLNLNIASLLLHLFTIEK